MDTRVAAFLNKCEEDKQRQDYQYYYLVMSYAGLLSSEKDYVEVSKSEYNKTLFMDSGEKTTSDGKYYMKKQIPIEISDEEFAAVEAAIPSETRALLRKKALGNYAEETIETSTSAKFFMILAWVIWIGGLIISIIMGNVSKTVEGYYGNRTTTEFSFSVFMSAYVVYLVSGAVCMCASELFKKLQTIVNLLRQKA